MTAIKTAFSTLACPDWSWQELLEHGPRYGYDGVEIRLLERETDLLARTEFRPAVLADRRRELSRAGFQVCGLASSVRFDYPDENQRAEQLAVGRRYVELAAELQASFVRVFGDVLPEAGESERRRTVENIADGLQRLGEYAEECGLSVLIETHGDYSSSPLVRQTLELVDSRAVGVLWDTHHPWRFCRETLDETWACIGPWVRHTHWKDSVSRPKRSTGATSQQAARNAHALMSGHRHADYVLFGGGEFPAPRCLRLLARAGYDGWFCYEWEKMWHPEIEDPELALPLFPGKMRELWSLVGE